MDNHEKYCKGCKYYFNPKNNVLCNKTGDSCKRLTLAMIDSKIDYYKPIVEEEKTK